MTDPTPCPACEALSTERLRLIDEVLHLVYERDLLDRVLLRLAKTFGWRDDEQTKKQSIGVQGSVG